MLEGTLLSFVTLKKAKTEVGSISNFWEPNQRILHLLPKMYHHVSLKLEGLYHDLLFNLNVGVTTFGLMRNPSNCVHGCSCRATHGRYLPFRWAPYSLCLTCFERKCPNLYKAWNVQKHILVIC